MAIGINEIDDEELELDEVQEDEEELNDDDSYSLNEDDDDDQGDRDDDQNSNFDPIIEYLKDNGIADASKIKFEDENGEVVEKSWETLTPQEQLNILRSNQVSPEIGLDDEEINFINFLRSNNITPNQYHEYMSQQQNQAQTTQQEPVYTSDSFTDDELFIVDLQSRIPDITDEEITAALTQAKSNPEFYLKLVAGIRNDYQRLEKEEAEKQQAIAQLELEEAYNAYSNAVVNEIANLKNIGDLDISMNNDDMDELADFLLAVDDNGVNYFNKALQDPETLVKMAWFALHGDSIFNGISDYYKGEISRAHKAGYQEGKKAASKSPVVVKQNNNSNSNNFRAKSINDLDGDF